MNINLDDLDGRVLKVRGRLCVADWTIIDVEGMPEFLPSEPEIKVSMVLPQGGQSEIGVIGERGIFDVEWSDGIIRVTNVAPWGEIEIVPDVEWPTHE